MKEAEFKNLVQMHDSLERSILINKTPIAWTEIFDALQTALEKETQDGQKSTYIWKLMNVRKSPKNEFMKFLKYIDDPQFIVSIFYEFHGISLDKILNRLDELSSASTIGSVLYNLAIGLDTEITDLLDNLENDGYIHTTSFFEVDEYNSYPSADWLIEFAPTEDERLKESIEEWKMGVPITDREYFKSYVRSAIKLILIRLGNMLSKTNDTESILNFASDFPGSIQSSLMARLVELEASENIKEILSFYRELYKQAQDKDDKQSMSETLNVLRTLYSLLAKAEWFKELGDNNLDIKHFELGPVNIMN